jgi:hypothetical protein
MMRIHADPNLNRWNQTFDNTKPEQKQSGSTEQREQFKNITFPELKTKAQKE